MRLNARNGITQSCANKNGRQAAHYVVGTPTFPHRSILILVKMATAWRFTVSHASYSIHPDSARINDGLHSATESIRLIHRPYNFSRERRSLPASDPELRALFIRRIGQFLLMMMRKGVVRQVQQPGRFNEWELV